MIILYSTNLQTKHTSSPITFRVCKDAFAHIGLQDNQFATFYLAVYGLPYYRRYIGLQCFRIVFKH